MNNLMDDLTDRVGVGDSPPMVYQKLAHIFLFFTHMRISRLLHSHQEIKLKLFCINNLPREPLEHFDWSGVKIEAQK